MDWTFARIALAVVIAFALGCESAAPVASDGAVDAARVDPLDGSAIDAAVDALMNPPECPATVPSNGGGVNRCGESDLTCRYPGWLCNCREGRPGNPGWWYCNPDECSSAGNGQPCQTVGLRCMLRFEADCVCEGGKRWSCSGGLPDMAK